MAIRLGEFLDKMVSDGTEIAGIWLEVLGMRYRYRIVEIQDHNSYNALLIADALMPSGKFRKSQARFSFYGRDHIRNFKVLSIQPSGGFFGVRANVIVRCR